jgi:adenosylcobinamide amidohydrolase
MKTDIDGCAVSRNDRHVLVAFASPRTVISSGVIGGGLTRARGIVNLRVPKHEESEQMALAPPEETLAAYCRQQRWQGPMVGMMTAASMDSFRRVDRCEGQVAVTALVTAGISNAGRAGDPAQYRDFCTTDPGTGTVNIILLTNAELTDAALVEAVITVTEAKAAAFENLGIRSVATGRQATGTGTDSVAVVSGSGPVRIQFCGKHVLLGEMLADATIRAVSDSLSDDKEHR